MLPSAPTRKCHPSAAAAAVPAVSEASQARHAPEDLSSRWDVAWGSRVGKVLLDPVMDAAAVLGVARELEVTAILHGHKHWYGNTGYRVGGVPVFNAGSTTLMDRPRVRILDFAAGAWVGIHELQITL